MGEWTDKAPSRNITSGRRLERTHDELVGICRGVLADGHVNVQEAQFLKDWIERNQAFMQTYPFDVLHEQVRAALADGVISSDEERDLLGTLVKFVGGEAFNAEAEVASLSTALPLDDPAPVIQFEGAGFVLTGTFEYGSRADVSAVIAERGGIMISGISKKARYLLVGALGSRDWMHSNSGRKIEAAVELRSKGVPLYIIAESHWQTCI